jgi:hypothetical protein
MALPSSQMVPRSAWINAGQRFNQRRFSRAVFAQQRHDFAAPQAEIDVIQRLNAGEEFTKSFGAKDLLVCSALIIDVTLMSGYPGSRWASRGYWNAAFTLSPGRGWNEGLHSVAHIFLLL